MSFLYKILPHEQLSDKVRKKNSEKEDQNLAHQL